VRAPSSPPLAPTTEAKGPRRDPPGTRPGPPRRLGARAGQTCGVCGGTGLATVIASGKGPALVPCSGCAAGRLAAEQKRGEQGWRRRDSVLDQSRLQDLAARVQGQGASPPAGKPKAVRRAVSPTPGGAAPARPVPASVAGPAKGAKGGDPDVPRGARVFPAPARRAGRTGRGLRGRPGGEQGPEPGVDSDSEDDMEDGRGNPGVRKSDEWRAELSDRMVGMERGQQGEEWRKLRSSRMKEFLRSDTGQSQRFKARAAGERGPRRLARLLTPTRRSPTPARRRLAGADAPDPPRGPPVRPQRWGGRTGGGRRCAACVGGRATTSGRARGWGRSRTSGPRPGRSGP